MPRYGTFRYGEERYGGEAVVIPEWTPLTGGNHRGEDWVLADGDVIAGTHYNIGRLILATGVTVFVAPWDGASYGELSLEAHAVEIDGILAGTGAGFQGGGAGGGGGGASATAPALGGVGGLEKLGGAAGANGDPGSVTDGGAGGTGGLGRGTYGGAGGPGGAPGVPGGYNTATGQGDSSTDDSLLKGSGGGGGGGGAGQTLTGSNTQGGGGGGGGGGGSGGGTIKIFARGSLRVAGAVLNHGELGGVAGSPGNAATVAAAGLGGDGGDATEGQDGVGGAGGGGSPGGAGGAGSSGGRGAGGGVLLKCSGPYGVRVSGLVSTLGGGHSTANGGTLKVRSLPGRYTVTGTVTAGRTHTTATTTRVMIAA